MVVKKLFASTPYEFIVQAVSDIGSGQRSRKVVVPQTLDPVAPEAVEAVTVSDITPEGLKLRWTPPEDNGSELLYYIIERCEEEKTARSTVRTAVTNNISAREETPADGVSKPSDSRSDDGDHTVRKEEESAEGQASATDGDVFHDALTSTEDQGSAATSQPQQEAPMDFALELGRHSARRLSNAQWGTFGQWGTWRTEVNASEPFLTVTEVEPEVGYQFRVAAVNLEGQVSVRMHVRQG